MGETTDNTETTRRQASSYDYILMLLTLGLLAALGVQSMAGTAYTWWAQRTIEGWEQTGYAGFVETMNFIAAPLVIALVVVMGLCVPKRLFDRRILMWVSVALVAAAVATAALRGIVFGLSLYLVGASLLQAGVVAMTLAGAPSLRYLSEGRMMKVGSGLLHMGVLLFMLVVVALQQSSWMLPVFWVSAAMILGGSAVSFYAGPRRRAGGHADEEPVSDDENGERAGDE